ncbi:MAG: hypothetical protein FJW36_05110 [Acidobacteria bacterium]|nr:hypothetical protein [Acidobacteriota bacterium]
MQIAIWLLTKLFSDLLTSDSEREAILGDFEERHLKGTWRALGETLRLVMIRQAQLWKTWQPWLLFLVLLLPINAVQQACGSILEVLFMQPLGSQSIRMTVLFAAILTITLGWRGGFCAARLGGLSRWSVLFVVLATSQLAIWRAEPTVRAWFLITTGLLTGLPTLLGAWRASSPSPLDTSSRLLLFSVQVMEYCGLFLAAQPSQSTVPQDPILIPVLLWPMALPLLYRASIRTTQ